ncbi:MAG TPA: UDP-N-acetylmuramoyl-L-alanine--D-glutamate ligase [Armatimonadota bacterium]|nr:UDP-N-acetylmuramoyl-L-alanine--D-glutamate ligase [Armatimonadota bacterium]
MTLQPARTTQQLEAYRSELRGRSVAVIGAARSGLACARLLTDIGARVTLADRKPADELPEAAAIAAECGFDLLPGFSKFEQLPEVSLIVTSPALRPDHQALVPARAAGVEVIGSLELGWRLCPMPVVAITGTNGKGTCCRLLDQMLARGGVPHVLAGNIGRPLADAVPSAGPERAERSDARKGEGWSGAGGADAVAIVEVSSFQLMSIVDFRPSVAVLLNVAPDHFDWHLGFEEYLGAKARLFMNQAPDDFAIINLDDPVASGLAGGLRAEPLHVSVSRSDVAGRVEGAELVVELAGRPERICGADEFTLAGRHHLPAVLSAAIIARLLGLSPDVIAGAIRSYQPPPHHMEVVARVGEVVFISDSKATNPAAAVADLSALDRPYVAIVGGKDKGADFAELGALLNSGPRAVILIGEAADRIAGAMGEESDPWRANSLPEAMERALDLARPGDAVILAPACSSFDMFTDASHRGEVFREKALQLEAEHQRSQH